MRSADDYDPDRHAEEPQDGRSHLRSQLLSDFYSQLNHDLAGVDEPDDTTRRFVRERTCDEASAEELEALDELAALMAADPTTAELSGFYQSRDALRVAGVEADPFSFVSDASVTAAPTSAC
jgi:hypothetical protein